MTSDVLRRSVAFASSLLLTVAACADPSAQSDGSGHGAPVHRSAPAATPVASHTRPCYFDTAGDGASDDPRVFVDEEPIDAVAVWVPGLNSRRCRTVITTLPRTTARRIAADIAVAPAFPRGPISCPAADNTRVDLYFRYRHVREAQLADIGLSGCAAIGAPHRASRALPDPIRAALHDLAPPPWRRYVAP